MTDKARATLEQLQRRFGCPDGLEKAPPDQVRINSMRPEVWRRTGPSRGKETLYELER